MQSCSLQSGCFDILKFSNPSVKRVDPLSGEDTETSISIRMPYNYDAVGMGKTRVDRRLVDSGARKR